TTLIQLEVAQRLVAEPSTEPYGHLSVLVQSLAEGRITRRVPPKVFWPAPKVESAVLRLSRRADRPDRDEYERLKSLSSAVFQHRRKTLVHTLKESGTSPETARAALQALGLPTDARPERLSPPEFRLLARSLSSAGRQA
ncbi:MAG: rRNA adenine N-6-methyltransferase family protein, partial [Planctomycetota bacterium]